MTIESFYIGGRSQMFLKKTHEELLEDARRLELAKENIEWVAKAELMYKFNGKPMKLWR